MANVLKQITHNPVYIENTDGAGRVLGGANQHHLYRLKRDWDGIPAGTVLTRLSTGNHPEQGLCAHLRTMSGDRDTYIPVE